MPQLPELNPMLAPSAICTRCGNTMQIIPDKGPKGHVMGVRYVCQNEGTCNYEVYSDERLRGQAGPVSAAAKVVLALLELNEEEV